MSRVTRVPDTAASRAGWVERLDEMHLFTPLRIVLILLGALIASMVVRRAVRRTLSSLLERAGEHPRAEVRQRALASALRAALVGVIWTVAVITVISEVGVNIGAFVATATIVGGAIAFGAQTLIRDTIAGFFVLAEDQYGVGDEVDLGVASGTVERITLRSVRLRDGEGTVWYVAHGNIARVANSSKATSVALELQVARSSDAGATLAVAGRLAEALRSAPEADGALSGTPTVVGVTDVRDDRLVVRVSAPIRPSRADPVRRAWRRLQLEAFAAGDLVAPLARVGVAAPTPANPPDQ